MSRNSPDFNGFEILKVYIRTRDSMLDTLRSLGYEDARQLKDYTLLDSIREFISTLPDDMREYLEPEYERLCALRWEAFLQFQPLLEKYLRKRRYTEDKDVSGDVRISMYMALEKSLDRAKLPNVNYIFSWFKPTWENAIRKTYCNFNSPEEDRDEPLRRRELSVIFTDSYDEDQNSTLTPSDEETPESCLLERTTNYQDAFDQVIADAENIGEKAVVEYMLQLKREIEQQGRMPRLRKNSLELAKIRALLLAQGISPDML